MKEILLNDILNIKNLGNVKIRFLIKSKSFDPFQKYRNNKESILEDLFEEKNKKNIQQEILLLVFYNLVEINGYYSISER
jgi:hypothetical protein